MKKKLYGFLGLWLSALTFLLAGCVPAVTPPVDTEPVEPINETPGASVAVKAKWSSGNLLFEKKSDGTDLFEIDAGNDRIEAPDALFTTFTVTSPTISGTPVVANRASGNVSSNADGRPTIVVTHGLSGSPLAVFANWATDPGGDPGIFINSVGATTFTINATSANITGGTVVYWFAILAHE